MSDTMAQRGSSYSPKSSPFLNEVRKVMRHRHMSRWIEAFHLHYTLRFIRFRSKRHPGEMGLSRQLIAEDADE